MSMGRESGGLEKGSSDLVGGGKSGKAASRERALQSVGDFDTRKKQDRMRH